MSKQTSAGVSIAVTRIANVAVTGTAANDAAVTVECRVADPALVQVVVFSRSAAGDIHTVGQVVSPLIDGRSIRVADLHGRTDGMVQVQIFRAYGSVGQAVLYAVHQWRGYRFDGHSFNQTSGSTSFDVDTNAIRLTVAPATANFSKGGSRATFKVSVTNSGTLPASDVSALEIPPLGIAALPNTDCVDATLSAVLCHAGSIAPGATWSTTIELNLVDAVQAKIDLSGVVEKFQVRVGDQRYGDYPVTITVP
jgi:uncharacterized repeat protein (TIGR01451 family)